MWASCAGLDRKDLKIELSEGRLTVLKLKASASEAGSSTDPPAGTWTKIGSLDLPEDAITDSLYARLADEELFISIQRTPQVSAGLSGCYSLQKHACILRGHHTLH